MLIKKNEKHIFIFRDINYLNIGEKFEKFKKNEL